MMCSKPFIKTPVGVRQVDMILSQEARQAATPFGCGQCIHCRINSSRIWQHRIMLETMVHKESIFVTLTYDEENLPDGGNVIPEEITLFMKRLRKRISPDKIRYFAVGEYGENSNRPHYHLALFGIGTNKKQEIDKAWGMGWISLGDLNFASARYIVGYVTKGWTKEREEKLKGRNPEFMRCSKNNPGGLGLDAVKRIAQRCKDQKNLPERVIKELYHGKKRYPLGRYLTKKLNEYLGIPEEIFNTEFWEYQKEIFDKHAEEVCYTDSVLAEKYNERNKREVNQKYFQRRKTL